MHRLRFIARKEWYHILRDPRSLMIVVAMPVLMTFLYGYAINMDINEVVIQIADHDHTTESRELTELFRQSDYFAIEPTPVDLADPDALLRTGDADAVLTIKPGFGKALANSDQVSLGLVIDGSDAQMAYAVQNYSEGVVNTLVQRRLPPGMSLPGVRVSRQVLYNPNLESSHFFVPGLVAVILMMISALLTSITIAREKETGTMEQLLTAPVHSGEVLLGKLLPYTVIAFVDGVLVLLFARLIFDVPFHGSHLLMIGLGVVYIATALCIGILISSFVKTQQVAMMIALTATMLPSVMLSGFIFAVKNMPLLLQGASYIVPASYFVTVIRGIMLKGAGIEVLYSHAVALVGLMILMLAVAARRFRTRLD